MGSPAHPCRTLDPFWETTVRNDTRDRVGRVQVFVQTNLTLQDSKLRNPYPLSSNHMVYLEFLHHKGQLQLHLVNLTFYRVNFVVERADITFKLESCRFEAGGIHVKSTTARSHHDVTIDDCEFHGKFGDTAALLLEETGGVRLVRSLLHDIQTKSAIYCFESELTMENTALENIHYETANVHLGNNCNMTLRQITMMDAKYKPKKRTIRRYDMNAAIKLDKKNAAVTIVDSFFTRNDAPIKVEYGTVRINGSQFVNNSAYNGAGLELTKQSNASVHDCLFKNNIAEADAGAIQVTYNSTLNASSCIFEENSCNSDGGAIKTHMFAVVNLIDCVFDGNEAERRHGGAVYLNRRSNMTSHNTSYIRNTAAAGGGAVMIMDHSGYNATDGEFIENRATDSGTGFHFISRPFQFF